MHSVYSGNYRRKSHGLIEPSSDMAEEDLTDIIFEEIDEDEIDELGLSETDERVRFRSGADASRNSSWAAFLTKREVQALLSADTEDYFEMQPETMAFFQALRNCRNSRTESRNEEEDEDESMSFIIDAFNDLGVASRPSGSREARAMAQEEASSANSRGGRFEASSYSKEKAHLADNKSAQRQKPPKASKQVLERQKFASQLVMKSCMKDFRNYR